MLVGTSVVILTLGAFRVGMTLIEPYMSDAPGTTQIGPGSAILPPTKSPRASRRIPTVTGSTGQNASLWARLQTSAACGALAPGRADAPTEPQPNSADPPKPRT